MLAIPSAVEDCGSWNTPELMLGRWSHAATPGGAFPAPYPGNCILTARYSNPAQVSNLEKWKCVFARKPVHEYG